MEIEPVSLTINIAKCTFCRACELICSFVKEGAFSPALSRIQVVQVYQQGVNVPILCINCKEAPCVEACPTNAISRESDSLLMRIDESACSGCAECVNACPYAAIFIPPDREVPVICDLCRGEPVCVSSCLYGALRFENRPDGVLSTLPMAPSDDPVEARRWTLALNLARRLRRTQEVQA